MTRPLAFTLGGRRVCRPAPALALLILVAVVGCGEDPTSPTIVESEPALATTSTHALAFYQVSGGGQHTCGVTTDNRAYCWGLNLDGRLGDGTTTKRLKPVPVVGVLRFRQVSAGSDYTCGVTTEYRTYCWGSNADGALGDGTTTDRHSPVRVAGERLFRLVDAGTSHTCGVSYPDRKAYCWGYGAEGAVGDGVWASPPRGLRLTPVAVAGGRQFRQVAAGLDHTCGVTTSDEAFCWGRNRFGQLGDGSTASTGRNAPSRAAGTRRFRLVDAGTEFSCGVTTTHRAFCWGNGRRGQIGDGKTYLRFSPRSVAGGLSFERLSTGGSHTCGETTDNRVYCWGFNSKGELGDGTTTRRLTPVAAAGGRFFSQVSAGGTEFGSHTCGRTAAGVAYCWGFNIYGQLGDGSESNKSAPVPVAGG